MPCQCIPNGACLIPIEGCLCIPEKVASVQYWEGKIFASFPFDAKCFLANWLTTPSWLITRATCESYIHLIREGSVGNKLSPITTNYYEGWGNQVTVPHRWPGVVQGDKDRYPNQVFDFPTRFLGLKNQAIICTFQPNFSQVGSTSTSHTTILLSWGISHQSQRTTVATVGLNVFSGRPCQGPLARPDGGRHQCNRCPGSWCYIKPPKAL